MGTGIQQGAKGLQTPSRNVARSTPHNLPPSDPKFSGRFNELNHIHQLLRANPAVGISQLPAPHSRGGIGKSSVAIAYGWSHLEDFPGGVFVVNARSGLLVAEIAGLAELLQLRPRADQRKTAQIVCQKLAVGPRSLLILDGLDDATKWNQAEQQGIIPEGNCRCLVTTRRQSLSFMPMCVVGRLSRAEGVHMLAAFRPDAEQQANAPIAGDIVDLFDGLPIGLTLVAGYMALNEGITWESCRDRMKSVASKTIPDDGNLVHTGQNVPDYVQLVQNTFDEVLDSLPQQVRLGMEYATLFPANHIVTSWLRQFVQTEDIQQRAQILGDPVLTGQQVVAALLSLQVLRGQSPGYKLLSMPRILRDRMMHHFHNKNFQHDDAVDRVIEQMEKRATISELAVEQADLRSTLTPLVEVAKELLDFGCVAEGAKIANKIALVLHRLGRYQEVIAMLDCYLEDEVADQLDPLLVAVLLSDKAVTLAAMDANDEARRLMERAIQIEQKHLPPHHPTLASHFSNLAGILKSLGELDKAKRLVKHAIQIEEEQFGADHPTLGLRHWWVGDIELSAGRTTEALGEYWRAHEILTRHFTNDHPHVKRLGEIIERESNAKKDRQLSEDTIVQADTTVEEIEVRPNKKGRLPKPNFHAQDTGQSADKALQHMMAKRGKRRY